MLTAQREHGNGDSRQSPRALAEAQRIAIEHQHLAVGQPVSNRSVVALLPRHQSVRLGVYHHIFILYRHQPRHSVHRQHPLATAHILHLQIARRIPRTDGGMTATDSYCLPFQQLGGRDAKQQRATEQRQTGCLDSLATLTMNAGLIGVAIEMVGQWTVAPLIGEGIVFRRIEVILSRHQCPLLSQHLALGIFHLIVVFDVRQRMVPADQCRRLQQPQLPIVGLHRQVLLTSASVLTMVTDNHV